LKFDLLTAKYELFVTTSEYARLYLFDWEVIFMVRNHLQDLTREVLELRDRHPRLSLDNAFVAWFLRAFIIEDESSAVEALKGGSKDKGVDALYIDHEVRVVFVIQGKYHKTTKVVSANRSEVVALGDLGRALLVDDPGSFNALLENADPTVKDALEKAREALLKRGYRLSLQFVTTGKVSETHQEEASQRVEDWSKASFGVFSRDDLLRLMQDYIEGASPPVPTVSLPIHGEQLFNRDDKNTGISSWVFTMRGCDLGSLYNDIGDRLFARNIRGYQGNTDVNQDILYTLEHEPDYFWYFNNGVTVMSDDARQITERNRKYLRVMNAQIINGQQTVRTLATRDIPAATILVRVIVVPRKADVGQEQYSHLVGEIVKASNWQNAITQSDLMSNDIEQVRLERELRKLGYHYLRKKQTISEAKRITGNRYRYFIKKEDIAKAVGACLLDPQEVRLGRDRLFEDDPYRIIFSRRPAAEYSTFFWLSRTVSYISRGDIRRSYAKWLVLNFLWSQIKREFKRRESHENFRYVVEREYQHEREMRPLYSAIETIFRGAMAFYRVNRRVEERVLDESSFFNHRNRHHEFRAFWNSSENKKQSQVKKQLDTFIERIKETQR
jgi:hypothetical protein